MTRHEYYLDPGRNLDTDDHERLLDENREQYAQERREQLIRELENLRYD